MVAKTIAMFRWVHRCGGIGRGLEWFDHEISRLREVEMGIEQHSVAFLVHSGLQGVDFGQTATLGRQELRVAPQEMRRAFESAGRQAQEAQIARLTASDQKWVDPLLMDLGAEVVQALDISDYEGAALTWDLNTEIPQKFESRFSTVLEAGLLEHVFNFPVAIRNCMRMVETGGHLLLITPTNGESGHGFYQFSPELFFRTLSPRYGYQVQEMLFRETGSRRGAWYHVQDPAEVGARAQFRTRHASYLFVIARRVGPVPPFEPPPLQSDYVQAWTGDHRVQGSPVSRGRRLARRFVPSQGRAAWRHARYRRRPAASWYHRNLYAQLPSHFRRLRSLAELQH